MEWIDGEDVSRDTVTDARVCSDQDLLGEGGADLIATLVAQLWPTLRVEWEATGAGIEDLWARLETLGVDKTMVQRLRPDLS